MMLIIVFAEQNETVLIRRLEVIVEVGSYRIKPGRSNEFIKFFEERSIPALRSHGMKVLGPLLDLENPNWRLHAEKLAKPKDRDVFILV
jgi:hypothetical protein